MQSIQQLLTNYEIKKPANERRRLIKLLMNTLELSYFQCCNNKRITSAWNEDLIQQALNYCESYTDLPKRRLMFRDFCGKVNI